jgi:hypothetical protein
LRALKAAGIKYSDYLAVRKASPPGTKPKKRKAEPETSNSVHKESVAETARPKPEEASSETITFPIYFKGKPNGSLIVPKDVTPNDVKAIELVIPQLRAYAGNEENIK